MPASLSSAVEEAAAAAVIIKTARRRRRTSKDSDASDATDTSEMTAAVMEVEMEEAAVALGPSMDPSWERRLEEGGNGVAYVYGVDEAGRGPLAGPVVAAACYIPSGVVVPGIQVGSVRMDWVGYGGSNHSSLLT